MWRSQSDMGTQVGKGQGNYGCWLGGSFTRASGKSKQSCGTMVGRMNWLFNGPFCLGHPPQVNRRMMTKQKECVCGDAGRLWASLQHDLAELFCWDTPNLRILSKISFFLASHISQRTVLQCPALWAGCQSSESWRESWLICSIFGIPLTSLLAMKQNFSQPDLVSPRLVMSSLF